jgi:ribosomal protein S8
LDIDFNFRNLNLNSLSGYSAQFAGYKIDEGKLFLDLKYEIKESELASRNKITIKNIKLGDEVEDENITKLPLGFAIALLENNDGIIDIDMPIEGNVDKPDFKYGTIAFQAFSNLIFKAVASPFTLLGKLLGIEGDQLKGIDFEAGESLILPPEREKLDNLTNILLRKPKLSLSIKGSFDRERDLLALKAKKLKQKVLELSKQEHPTIEILEQIYTQMGGNTESLKDELKAKNSKNPTNGEYQKELYSRCVDMQSILGDELRELAQKRASVIQNYLAKSNRMDSEKISFEEIEILNNSNEKYVATELKIGVK